MKVSACSIACEACPKMVGGTCPSGVAGCISRPGTICRIAACA